MAKFITIFGEAIYCWGWFTVQYDIAFFILAVFQNARLLLLETIILLF